MRANRSASTPNSEDDLAPGQSPCSERFDPDGTYIKKFVPELKNVPSKFIHAPHEMSPALQTEIGCQIGKQYPAPIVDHAEAAERYKNAFMKVKQRA